MIPSEILNYQIIRQLGAGGMGQVFLARNKNIDQFVAIKMLHPQYANNPILRQKFKQEAVMLSSLNHPNIVRFLNYVENEHGVYLIMEFIDGMTLEDFINKKNGLIVEKRAYPMIDEILQAFSYAHARNIVHLDIKPGNIFITRDGHIKVMDFGIAKILSESGKNGEGKTMIMGTPEYMSPEQVLGRAVDPRSDIYSLGVLIHQMLTGRAPYDNTTLSQLEIKQHVINDTLPRMKEYYPYISDGMQKVVDKATAKLPDKRFRDCADMRHAVTNVLQPAPVNRKLWIGIGAAALVVLAAGFFTWDYFRLKTEYYADYAEEFGVPVGLNKLSGREMSHREYSYRMESSRRKPRRLTLVNSAGTPVPQGDSENKNLRFTDVEYFYTDDGKIDYKKIYDQYGHLEYKLDYDENLKAATFKYDDEYGTPMRISAETTNAYANNGGDGNRSTISRHLLDFNEKTGRLERMRYAGLNNEPMGDADNIYGMAYQYDSDGRIVELTFLGPDGKPRNNHIGLGKKVYSYNDDGLWTEVRYYSVDGSPSHDGNNCTVVTLEYDKWGNRSSEKYYTADGKPVIRTDVKNFGFAEEFDDHGNRVRQTNLGSDGKPMADPHGVTSYVFEHDDKGRSVRVSYRNADDQPVNFTGDGDIYASITTVYNDRNLPTETSLYGLDGKRKSLNAGYAITKNDYDSAGYVIKTAYYDASGNPTGYMGYNAAIHRQYDDLHRQTKVWFTDKNDKPATDEQGVYGYGIEYDVHGNISRHTVLGPDGALKDYPDFITVIKYKYDERGNEISREFFDSNDKPSVNRSGIHRIEFSYDPTSNLITQTKRYGLNALKETDCTVYDANGNATKTYTLNASGRLSGEVDNYEYDSRNRVVKYWASDLSGKKRNIEGQPCCMITSKYDDRGNVIERQFFDVSGNPAVDNSGTHRRVQEYNDRNLIVREVNYGKDGKPSQGRNAYPEGRVKYDDRGNMIELIALDGNGNPFNGAAGFHKMVAEYNELNKRVKTTLYDKDGKVVYSPAYGYAVNETRYDSKGNTLSEKYYKSAGVLDYEVTYKYNDKDCLIEMLVLDKNGKRNDSKFYFSRVAINYEADGITPKTRVYYNSYNSSLLTEKYNKSRREWN